LGRLLDIGSELLDVCFVFFYRTIKKCLAKPIQSNEETRHKILKIAKQLNYRPNRIARSLVNHKSNLISLIVADISNPFFAELARGIEDKARENGYFVIYCSTDNNQEDLESRVRLMQEVGVDGFIIAAVSIKEPIVEEIVDRNLPVVLINRRLKKHNANYVVVDNEKGAFLAVEHQNQFSHSESEKI
jgi:LacI family transcriptional regulator